MTVASQAITASDDIPRASDCCGRLPARSPEIFPGIQMSPPLPGKFRNRLVNSQLTGRSSNCTTVSKREESQEKECQESLMQILRIPENGQNFRRRPRAMT